MRNTFYRVSRSRTLFGFRVARCPCMLKRNHIVCMYHNHSKQCTTETAIPNKEDYKPQSLTGLMNHSCRKDTWIARRRTLIRECQLPRNRAKAAVVLSIPILHAPHRGHPCPSKNKFLYTQRPTGNVYTRRNQEKGTKKCPVSPLGCHEHVPQGKKEDLACRRTPSFAYLNNPHFPYKKVTDNAMSFRAYGEYPGSQDKSLSFPREELSQSYCQR